MNAECPISMIRLISIFGLQFLAGTSFSKAGYEPNYTDSISVSCSKNTGATMD